MPKIESLITTLPGYDPFKDSEGYTFDADKANAAINWFGEYITHTKGKLAGKPYTLEPHERAIIANIFGWYDVNGHRRYREVLYYVPRKNSKSTLVAAIILYILYTEDAPHGEIYGAAAAREQAALVFDIAKGMVLNNPELARHALVQQKIIEVGTKVYKSISSDANTSHGYNTLCALIDELHVQKDRELVDVINTSTGAQSQPLVIYTTTADYCRESICNEKHDYACKVRDGIIVAPTFLPVIYEATLEDDWTDPKVWAQCNPMLDKVFTLDFLKKQYEEARETPAYENTFKRLHLNIQTEQADRWLGTALWDACEGKSDWEALAGLPVYLGVDLASTTDITACVGVCIDDDDVWHILPKLFVPKDNAYQRDKRDGVPYTAWGRDGYIDLTEGNTIDTEFIRKYINDLSEEQAIQEIAIDRWNAGTITTQLGGDGFDVVPFGQGFVSMSGPTKQLETLIRTGKLRHNGNPAMRWMFSNITVESDAAENLKINKKKSKERVDGIVALVMAIGRAMVAVEDEAESVYETRGLITL